MATTTEPTSPRSVVPGSPVKGDSHDVNAIVEDATKKFNDMDEQIKTLIQELKDQTAAMSKLNETRFKTAKHLESLVAKSPFAQAVKANVAESLPTASVEEGSTASGKDESFESGGEKSPSVKASVTEYNVGSFPAVYQSDYDLTKKFINQYDTYLIKYLVDWEHAVSTRVNGLLIHYRELHQNAVRYQKKVGGLLTKVDKTKSVRRTLAEKLDRNEIKEMGAIEARDTVGEHIFLLIDEVTERVWRDMFPLLLRALRFEADFSAQQSNLFSHLTELADVIQVIGEDYDCELFGRVDDIAKKHPEEIYTVENPFVKLRPVKSPPQQPDLPKDDSADDEDAEEAAFPEDTEAASDQAVEEAQESTENEVKESLVHV